MKISSCRINGETCPSCEVVHGKEAEELRRAIEKYMGEVRTPYDIAIAMRLQDILDDVDARDALAYVESLDRKLPKKRRK